MQYNFTTPNGSGYNVRNGINQAFQSAITGVSGATDPATLTPSCAFPNSIWKDTGNNLYKERDTANTAWVVKGRILSDGTVDLFKFSTTLASASTMTIGAAEGETIFVTGTTTITAFDSPANGAPKRTLIFGSALTIDYSANLLLPNSSNLSISAGDIAEFVYEGSGVWQCSNYQPIVSTSVGINMWKGSEIVVVGQIAYSANMPSWAHAECTTAGTTGVTEPAWGTTEDALITDNTAVWRVARYLTRHEKWKSVVFKDIGSFIQQTTSNTAITVTTDKDPYNPSASGLSLSLSMSSNGANGLDTGSPATGTSTFYNTFLIFNPTTGVTAGLISLSATAPTLPTGYTYFVRTGSIVVNASGYLYRTIQTGDKVSYVVDGTILSGYRQLANGTIAMASYPTALYVPLTAKEIIISYTSSGAYAAEVIMNITSVTNSINVISYQNSAGTLLVVSVPLIVPYATLYSAGAAIFYVIGWSENL